MGWQDFFEGAMRTGAASFRGYMEAKVEVAQARNEQELHRAQQRLIQERNNLLKQKNQYDFELGQMQITSQEGIAARDIAAREKMHEETQETARHQITTDHEGRMYVVDVNAGTAVELKKMETDAMVKGKRLEKEGAENVAKTRAEGAQNVAETQGGTAENVAKIQGGAAEKVAEIQAQGNVNVAKIQGDAARDVAETQSKTNSLLDGIESGKIGKGLGAKELFGMSYLLREQAAAAGVELPTKMLTEEERGAVVEVKSKMNTDIHYRAAMAVQRGYISALEGYRRSGGAGDLAMVIGLAKILDPESVVRQEEAEAVQKAQDFLSRQAVTFTEDVFADQVNRDKVMRLIQDLYNHHAPLHMVDLKKSWDLALSTGVLAGAGLVYEDLGRLLNKDPRTLLQLMDVKKYPDSILYEAPGAGTGGAAPGGTGGAAPGGTGGAAPEPGAMRSDEVPGAPAPGGESNKIWEYAKIYKAEREKGTDEATLDAMILGRLGTGRSQEEKQRILDQIKQRAGTLDPSKQIGQTKIEIDEARRLAKSMDVSQLVAADLRDMQLRDFLKIKYALGYQRQSASEWQSEFRPTLEAQMREDGVPAEVIAELIKILERERAERGRTDAR